MHLKTAFRDCVRVRENVFNLYEEMPDLNIHAFRLIKKKEINITNKLPRVVLVLLS